MGPDGQFPTSRCDEQPTFRRPTHAVRPDSIAFIGKVIHASFAFSGRGLAGIQIAMHAERRFSQAGPAVSVKDHRVGTCIRGILGRPRAWGRRTLAASLVFCEVRAP